jgi:hypothetical protein
VEKVSVARRTARLRLPLEESLPPLRHFIWPAAR